MSQNLPIPPEALLIEPRHEAAILTVTGAARLLGVHPNTVRAWTDQGRLRCLRINERGDRRYRAVDLQNFLDDAGLAMTPFKPFVSRMQPIEALPDIPERDAQTGPLTPVASVSTPPVRALRPAAAVGGRSSAPALARIASVPPLPAEPETSAAASFSMPAAPPRPWAVPGPGGSADSEVSLVEQIRDQLRNPNLDSADLGPALNEAAQALLKTGRFRAVVIAEWRDGNVVPHARASTEPPSDWLDRIDGNAVAVCIREGRQVTLPTAVPRDAHGDRPPATLTVFSPIGPSEARWGVLITETTSDRPLSGADLALLDAVTNASEVFERQRQLALQYMEQKRRSDAVVEISAELSAPAELNVLLDTLLERLLPMFSAQRAAVWRVVDGQTVAEASANLSSEYIDAVRALSSPPIGVMTASAGQTVVLHDLANNPDIGDVRFAIEREGFRTAALVPLAVQANTIGALSVYHDSDHTWTQPDLDLLRALGAQAGQALRNANNYQLMATWAAQLQSIQQIGTRLNRFGTVAAIGQAIAMELRQLIDYHNVRVYRVHGDSVDPVAWRGEIGEYTDEDRDQLRLTVGQGITGWVAKNGLPQYLPDAAKDPRSQTIAGTEADLDESMLIAPMLYEDGVIGVIVLSKLGLNQFSGDDLRYLEIYASIAAQAMVNADATEQLKAQSDRLLRQVASQRELMRVTESILSTLDPRVVIEEIVDRLGGLLKVDNIAIGVLDPAQNVVRTLFARGVDEDMYMGVTLSANEGIGGWVLEHDEALLIPNILEDPRYLVVRDHTVPASVIVAPLRSRDTVLGVLLLERVGEGVRFDDDEFDLLKLFAGHVSIALQNAEAHRAVEIRAQTDALTGLKNQGTFQEYLQVAVKRGAPFSLLIVDLDEFKAFNDRRGHESGNVMLATIADALRSSCRDSDELFRYGGDEFAVILPNTDAAGAMRVAVKVGRAIRTAPAPGLRKAAGVTASIGVAAFPDDASARDTILLAADRACYVAKRDGRDRAVTAADALAMAGDVLPDGPTPFDDPEDASEHAA